MNKILNWTFGACFRTLGKILAIFLVGALLFILGSKIGIQLPSWLIMNVNATTEGNWAWRLSPIPRMNFYDASDMSSESIYWTDMSYLYTDENNNITWGYWENLNSLAIGPNGYLWEFPTGIALTPNYLYTYQMGICSNKNLTPATLLVYAGNYGSLTNTDVYSVSSLNYMNSNPFTTESLGNCYLLYGYYVPSTSTAWSHLRINSPNTTISSADVRIISFDIEPVGIWSSAIEDSISNSGFSTAESVAEVQESVTQVKEEVQELNNSIDETNNTIKDNDITGAEDSASGFFNDFNTETFGLTSIITSPLNAINSIINSSCNNLVLPLPFVDKNLTLPCMTTIYSNYFKGFFDLYQIITTGLISYYIIVRIFNLVKDFKNPEHDEIEVMDL